MPGKGRNKQTRVKILNGLEPHTPHWVEKEGKQKFCLSLEGGEDN